MDVRVGAVVALIAFAFVAGAATALSPCVLPVLPVVLSAGLSGGRRRPFGIVTGLTLSFAFATVALVYVIDALGLPDDLLRNVAIAVLLGFGIVLLLPPVAARVEAWIGRFVPKARNARTDGGFGSGLLVGASLGFVYAPCAGPILAGVITVSASQEFTAGRLAVALAYARRQRGRALRADARRAPLDESPLAPGGASPDGHGRGDGGRGGAHVRRLRHPLPDRHRQRPAGLPG